MPFFFQLQLMTWANTFFSLSHKKLRHLCIQNWASLSVISHACSHKNIKLAWIFHFSRDLQYFVSGKFNSVDFFRFWFVIKCRSFICWRRLKASQILMQSVGANDKSQYFSLWVYLVEINYKYTQLQMNVYLLPIMLFCSSFPKRDDSVLYFQNIYFCSSKLFRFVQFRLQSFR